MTEQEIIYSLLETIRAAEVSDDEKTTEAYLRNILSTYRADAIKSDYDISQESYQDFTLQMQEIGTNGMFESTNLPGIIYESGRIGFQIYDYGTYVPITTREEAVGSQSSRFFSPKFIGYISGGKLKVSANLSVIEGGTDNDRAFLNQLRDSIEVHCVLLNPGMGNEYNWKKTPYPMQASKISLMKQNILRREFGISAEIKRDEIQNTRQDNIIYQDESKLYK